MRHIYLFLLVLLGTLSAQAQDKGSIVGVLSDKEVNNEPLPFATVQLQGTTKGATTDFDGLYQLENVDPGTYTLIFSFVGYETLEIPNVIVEAGKVTTVNTGLSATAAALDEVVITTTTSRESEVALLLEQKKAVAIQQTIGADELARKGVSDAAAAIAKISGISKQSSGAGNVYVRGLGDRYLNTTFNGLSLPSNNIERKNIDLDLFPSDVIQNVSVSKAYSTKFYGDFAASNIDVISKDYKGRGFLDVSLEGGINSRAVGKNSLRSEGTGYFGMYNRYSHNPFAVVLSHGVDPVDGGTPINVTGTLSAGKSFDFKDDTRLSIFFTASFDNNFEYRKGSAVDYTTVDKQRFDDVEEYAYSTTTTGMASLIYRINSKHRLNFNSLVLNSSNDEVGDFGVDGGGENRDAIRDTDRGFFVRNILFEQDLIFVNQLSGLHQIDDDFELSWGVGYNKVFSHQPDRKRFSLERYDLALDGDPTTSPTFYNNTNFDNQRYFQDIEDEELNSRINLEYTASENFKLNFGYNGRTKERYFENIRYGYDLVEPNTEAPDINNLNDVFNVPNLGVVYDTYVFRPIDPSHGVDNRNYPGLPENRYTGNLDIHAGYINAEITSGKWLFVPGFRMESYEQSIKYDVINLINGVGSAQASENFYLPSLNVRYALNEDQNLRFSFSKTVSFPEFKEVAPFVYEDVTTRVGGNPDLLGDPSISDIYNFDLKYEWFISSGELFSLAAFAKEIKDPINKVIANDATGTQRYFRTGDKANVYGVELEIRKNLISDENNKPNLAVGFNATYMHTEQDLRSSNGLFSSTLDRSDELQGASPFLINADIAYSPTNFENYRPVANLVYSYFDDRIDALGAGQLGNIVEKGVHVLDFVFRNEIGTDWEVNFSAKNLLDPSIEYIRENTSIGDVTISTYKRGIDLSLGVKYKF